MVNLYAKMDCHSNIELKLCTHAFKIEISTTRLCWCRGCQRQNKHIYDRKHVSVFEYICIDEAANTHRATLILRRRHAYTLENTDARTHTLAPSMHICVLYTVVSPHKRIWFTFAGHWCDGDRSSVCMPHRENFIEAHKYMHIYSGTRTHTQTRRTCICTMIPRHCHHRHWLRVYFIPIRYFGSCFHSLLKHPRRNQHTNEQTEKKEEEEAAAAAATATAIKAVEKKPTNTRIGMKKPHTQKSKREQMQLSWH